MDEQVFNDTMNSITDKVGEETAAVIADDIGTLKSAQKSALDKQAEYEKKIAELEKTRDQLITSNANLLRQIPVHEDNKLVPNSQPKDKETRINTLDAFDEFGRLKK